MHFAFHFAMTQRGVLQFQALPSGGGPRRLGMRRRFRRLSGVSDVTQRCADTARPQGGGEGQPVLARVASVREAVLIPQIEVHRLAA